MRNGLIRLLLLFFSFFLVLPPFVLADGGIFPPPNYYVGQTDQKAVIFYDQGVETLIISITFQGNAKDFGWVVPSPTRPEVDKSSDELFLALEELTQRPLRRVYEEKGLMAPEAGVEVIETKEVGIYEISVLKADDPKALSSWLSENGYNFPKEASYVLEDYIKNKWYFTAVKVRPGLVWQGVEEQLRSGHATPLKLIFKSEKIVYPLKISSVARYFSPPLIRPMVEEKSPEVEVMPPWSGGSVGILLYVFADKEKDLPGFSTLYAEEIEEKEIENLAYNDDGTSWIDAKGDFILTKLQRGMQPVEMTNDLILRDKASGIKIKPESLPTPTPSIRLYFEQLLERGWLKPVLFLFALAFWFSLPITWIFVIALIIAILAKTKPVRAVAWIFQGISLLGWFLLMLFFSAARFSLLKEEVILLPKELFSFLLSSGFLLFLLMISGLFFQFKQEKKQINR